MIVITGANGFIGCNLVRKLNALGRQDLILVDHFDIEDKKLNLESVLYSKKIDRDIFIDWLIEFEEEIEIVFHLGARTDTTEFNFRILDSLNLSYSKRLWEICTVKQIPFIYASSAATYGTGEQGFDDNHDLIRLLKPLNPYGVSKQLFDEFVLEEKHTPPFWFGLKFFNVYGPYEHHKKRMASVVYHAYHQIKQNGSLKLFQSHNPNFIDGGQLRDFIYVDDVVDVCLFLKDAISLSITQSSGIYNLGTGKARTFNDLAKAIFNTMNREIHLSYIPTPEDIRDKYQYFTEAKMTKLAQQGYLKHFMSLEEGVKQYITYLEKM